MTHRYYDYQCDLQLCDSPRPEEWTFGCECKTCRAKALGYFGEHHEKHTGDEWAAMRENIGQPKQEDLFE